MEKYFKFDGIASRSEYWAVNIIGSVLAMVAITVGAVISSGANIALLGLVIILVSSVVLTWALIATGARRCRDAGINPWWVLAQIIPYVGFVVWIVIGVLQTKQEIVNGN